MKPKTMSVRAKLTTAFGGLSLLVLLVAGLSLKSLGDANGRFIGYVQGINARALTARSLAQRSAEAAKQIKTLIGTSVDQVGKGTSLVDEAGATMNQIVQAIKRVTDIVGEISLASTEQSEGVAQVGVAVAQMDQTTQQNAALVEESAAAAESLKQQALEMVDVVAVFQLSNAA